MAERQPKIIDGEYKEVSATATLADVVSPDVQSVTTVGGHLIRRAEFAQRGVPDGFETNLTAQEKG